MTLYQVRKEFRNSNLIKQIIREKFPNHTVDQVTTKFIEFWNKKYKKNPTILDFIYVYRGQFRSNNTSY